MIKLKRLSMLIVIIFMAAAVSVFFQNCAQSKFSNFSLSSEDPKSLLGFFHYNYIYKPNLYANLALVFPTESSGTFARFNIYGMVSPADGTNGTISYVVDITDDGGQTVCAGNAGVLNPDQQNIEFECLGSASLTKANVVLTATFNGTQESFRASFTK